MAKTAGPGVGGGPGMHGPSAGGGQGFQVSPDLLRGAGSGSAWLVNPGPGDQSGMQMYAQQEQQRQMQEQAALQQMMQFSMGTPQFQSFAPGVLSGPEGFHASLMKLLGL